MLNTLVDYVPKLLEASSDSSASAGGSSSQIIILVVWLVVIFAAMYFLMIRPSKKKQKAEEKMRNELQIGDEIVTISGVYCRVVAIKDDSLIVESGPDRTKMRIARWAIQQNLTVHE